MTDAVQRALDGPDNFTGPFWFQVEYEIDISEALMKQLQMETVTDRERADLIEEHLHGRTGHVNVRKVTPEFDSEDELWEEFTEAM